MYLDDVKGAERLLSEKGLFPLLEKIEEAVNQLELPRGACSYLIDYEIGELAKDIEAPEECAFLALIESAYEDAEATDCLSILGSCFGLPEFFLNLRKSVTEAQASSPTILRCQYARMELLKEKIAASEVSADNLSLCLFLRVMEDCAEAAR